MLDARLAFAEARARRGHGSAGPSRWRRPSRRRKRSPRSSEISRAASMPSRADVEIAVIAALGGAVERPAVAEASRAPAPRAARHGHDRSDARSASSRAASPKPTHRARRQRARAQPALLPAAVEQRIERDAVAHPQRADALGPVDLVRRQRDQVAGVERQRHAAEALDRVAEEQARPAPWASAASSATGWITPISLLTSIAATRPVRPSIAAAARSRSTSPSRPTGRIVDLEALAVRAMRRCRARRHARSRA